MGMPQQTIIVETAKETFNWWKIVVPSLITLIGTLLVAFIRKKKGGE